MTARNANLLREISALKVERQAVILAHHYQTEDVQSIADFTGDSLELSQQAAATKAKVIVFCGVYFMAETAKILAPDKIVLLPERNAGCPMADMITAPKLEEKKASHPGAAVVCYVNSTAEVKAASDICCTSANAVKVVSSLDADEIIFVPDKHLGSWVAAMTHKKIHPWPGFCPTHACIGPEDIAEKKRQYPQALVAVHPECRPEVIAMADVVLSTSGIIRYGAQANVKQLIVGTEIGVVHRLMKENQGREFVPATDMAVCPSMKLTTLNSVLRALQNMEPEITVPEDIRTGALTTMRRMLEVT